MNKIRKPNLFIVGAGKSGTTSLNYWLNQHPDIFMYSEEGHFFDHSEKYIQKNLKQYESRFAKTKKRKYLGEKSPQYFYPEKIAKILKDYSPEAKIIIILRNPVDMVFSLYHLFLWDGKETSLDFESVLEKEEKGFRKKLMYYDGKFNASSYRDFAEYYPHTKRYIDLFGRENVHIIIFEDFAKNPEGEYKKILDFLKLSDFKPDFKRIGVTIKSKYLARTAAVIRTFPKFVQDQLELREEMISSGAGRQKRSN